MHWRWFASVPSWRIQSSGYTVAVVEVFAASVPDSFLLLASSSQDPVVEIRVGVGYLGAVQPVDLGRLSDVV